MRGDGLLDHVRRYGQIRSPEGPQAKYAAAQAAPTVQRRSIATACCTGSACPEFLADAAGETVALCQGVRSAAQACPLYPTVRPTGNRAHFKRRVDSHLPTGLPIALHARNRSENLVLSDESSYANLEKNAATRSHWRAAQAELAAMKLGAAAAWSDVSSRCSLAHEEQCAAGCGQAPWVRFPSERLATLTEGQRKALVSWWDDAAPGLHCMHGRSNCASPEGPMAAGVDPAARM